MIRDTSIAAYKKIIDEGIVGDKQLEVFELLAKENNLTDSEIMQMLGYKDPNKVRPRRKELVDLQLIEENGKRACNVTKINVYQWRMRKKIPSIRELKNIQAELKKKKMKCPMCKGEGFITNPQTTLIPYNQVRK